MFYDPTREAHGLKHDPWKSLVVPRPIGWVSTVSTSGVVNLAPYSFFNGVSDHPHYVMFASAGLKDSQRNAEETGEFVCVMSTKALQEHMNITAADLRHDESEVPYAGLTPVASTNVKPPRFAESPVAIECEYHQTVQLPAGRDPNRAPYAVVFGRVVGIHIDDTIIKDGMVDVGAMQPIARLGYHDYAVVREDTIFSMIRPSADELRAKASA
ncbi:MAG: flavin reductase family protein [Pseudomonadota bacterium]